MQKNSQFSGWAKPIQSWKLAAKSGDKNRTVFLVSTTRMERVETYTDGTVGYRARYDIAVVYWPENRAVGMKTLISDPPAFIDQFRLHRAEAEIVGTPFDVYRWIDTLPLAY